MTDNALGDDLAGLRKEFEGSGFTFGSVWASAGAGPDARRLFASRGTLLITSWNAAALRRRVREEMRRSQQTVVGHECDNEAPKGTKSPFTGLQDREPGPWRSR